MSIHSDISEWTLAQVSIQNYAMDTSVNGQSCDIYITRTARAEMLVVDSDSEETNAYYKKSKGFEGCCYVLIIIKNV